VTSVERVIDDVLCACCQTLERSVVENLEEIVTGVLLALFDADETHSSYAAFIKYVVITLYFFYEYTSSGLQVNIWIYPYIIV